MKRKLTLLGLALVVVAAIGLMTWAQVDPNHVIEWVYPLGSRTVVAYVDKAGNAWFKGTLSANSVTPSPTYATNAVDRTTPGALAIGPTNATSVVITPPTNQVGDFTVNTSYFTVDHTTGNTGVKGDFAVNTNKFSVAAASGNTAIGGTLAITGTTTLTGGIRVPAAGGAADKAGQATLTTGAATVSTTAVTANSLIQLTFTGTRATTTVAVAADTIVAGTSFDIHGFVAAGTAASGDSTTVVNWLIVN